MITMQNCDSALYDNKNDVKPQSRNLKKSKKKSSFHLFFYSGVILFTIGIFIVIIIVAFQSPEHENKIVAPQPHQVFLKRGRSLWIYDKITNNITISITALCNIRTYDAYRDDIIFISDDCSPIISSYSSNYSNFGHTNKWKPKTIALDFITDNMYVLDDNTNSLNVIDKKNKHYAKVLTNIQDFVLEPTEGILFYVAKSIWKSNMDGSAQKQLINCKNHSITAITIDRDEKLLYWLRESTHIERSDYNGTNRTLVHSTVRHINSLAAFGDTLYLSINLIEHVDFLPEQYLWLCKLKSKSPCAEKKWVTLPGHEFELMRPLTYYQKYVKAKPNPCQIDNGNCQHLCLLSASGSEGHGCACYIGWHLNADLRSCSLASEILVYINGQYVKIQNVDGNRDDFKDDIEPTRIWQKQDEDNGFDYDLLTGYLFFSYQCDIYKLNLRRNEEPKLVFRSPRDWCIHDVMRDPEKERLYYVMRGPLINATIAWSSMKEDVVLENRKDLVTLTYRKYKTSQQCLHSLLVHQSGEYVFYTDMENSYFNLRRVLADGTSSIIVAELLYYNSPSLSMDYETNRLYWLHDKYDGIVKHANPDGTDVRLIKLFAIKSKTRLVVKGRWFYASTNDEIWRFDKLNGTNRTKITDVKINGISENIHGFKIFSRPYKLSFSSSKFEFKKV